MSQNQQAGDGEKRVRCLYCGANNFPASPTCWQCTRPLQTLRPPTTAPAEPLPRHTSSPQTNFSRPASGDRAASTLAPKAAAALGLMFPFIGLPVGMVFLMLDDPRKTQIGWITIGWSVAGSIASTLLLIPLAAPTLALLRSLLPHPGAGGLPGLSPTGDGSGDVNLLLTPGLRHAVIEILQASWHTLAFCARG